MFRGRVATGGLGRQCVVFPFATWLWQRSLICPLPFSLPQGLGQREVRGARPVACGLGGPEHRVWPHLLRRPQQQNDAVHRPAAAHHHKVTRSERTMVLVSDEFERHVKMSWFQAQSVGNVAFLDLRLVLVSRPLLKGLFLISVSD